jgi:hypothetical protein
VLEPLEQIECRDALLAWQQDAAQAPKPAQAVGSDHDFAQRNSCSDPDAGPQGARAVEAAWPRADVVIGNPPFLGTKKQWRELGVDYSNTLRAVYSDRVPGFADLVCYWFEKSRTAIVAGKLSRAGLVATNSIRGGKNRTVLDAISRDSRIYEAWSDEPWINEGAAVRVSLVAFGKSDQQPVLDGALVETINADLTSKSDLTTASKLPSNAGCGFVATVKAGAFDVAGDMARSWLRQPNPTGRSNVEVVKPWRNGMDVTRKPSDTWIIDFGVDTSKADAAGFEAPFEHVARHVAPMRATNKRSSYRNYWWLLAEPIPKMRTALRGLPRYLVTPVVAKHRLFAWLDKSILADHQLVTIARADDTTFGILHSRFHELWSLRMCTWLGVGNDPRYTPTTCFETFPFPAGLTPQDTTHQRTEALEGGALIPADLPAEPANFKQNVPQAITGKGKSAIKSILTRTSPRDAASAIAQAAHRLDALRQNWLNPPEWTVRVPEVVPLGLDASPYPDRIEPRPNLSEPDAKALQKRTLTNLYNQRPAWLAQAHAQLDAAVAAAYGWADYSAAMPDDEILKRLLALNLERAGGGKV